MLGRMRPSHLGSHQLRSPSSPMSDGHEHHPDDGGVEQDGDGEGDAELGRRDGPVTPKAMNTTIMMSAALVMGRPVRAMPSRMASLRVAGGLVALADRGQQEQLVVHRQPEEQGEEEQRCPGVDEALVLDADEARRRSRAGTRGWRSRSWRRR